MILFNFCVYVYLSAYCMYSESVYLISKRNILVHARNIEFKSLSELRVDDHHHYFFFALKRFFLFHLVIDWKHKNDMS